MEKILLRYEGRSEEVAYSQLDIPEDPTDQDVKTAVERHLDLNPGSLNDYEIDRYTTELVLRPQAKFGC